MYVSVDIDEAIPGEHGVHVHTFGDVSDPNGAKCGPHYNPYEEEHGCYPDERKVGDMGNVNIDPAGAGQYPTTQPNTMFSRTALLCPEWITQMSSLVETLTTL
jgi:Cu-Zn family superoxide dismutase